MPDRIRRVSAMSILLAGAVGVLVAKAVVAWARLMVSTERLVKTAESRLAALPCPRFGVAIGAEGAAAAKAAHDEMVRKLREMVGDRALPRSGPAARPCDALLIVLAFCP